MKVTVGKDFDGKPIRKSFYSTKSKEDAKAEQYKINQKVQELTGEAVIESRTLFATWARERLQTYKKGRVKEQYH